MRVILVVTHFPQLSETFIVSKWLGLLRRGWDAHVVCQHSPSGVWALYPELANRPELRSRIHVTWPARKRLAVPARYPIAIGRAAVMAPKHLVRYLWRAIPQLGSRVLKSAYLDARLIELRPDLIHFEFGALAIGRMYLPKAIGARSVVSFRGYDLNLAGLDQPGHFDEVFRSADGMHLLGEDLWRRAVNRGCSPDRSHVLIPPAIDTSFWNRPIAGAASTADGPTDGRFRVISVGRLEWKKGYEWLLAAVRRLVDDGIDTELTIVGDGSYAAAVGLAVHQLGLGDRVRMVGAVPRDGVRQLLGQAHVFLHGAVSEGFCNAVLEAQAMKLPVVTSDADGLAENVTDGVTGFVVPRRDPVAMSEALRRLAESAELRQRMGEAGRARALLPRFQVENQVERFDELYRSLLRR